MPRYKDGLFAVYLRKSRADMELEAISKFETLAIHEKELVALAKRDGYVLDKPFYKELVSGEHIADRDEFRAMMEKVEHGEYKGILVYAVARLGRGDPMEYGWVLYVLKRTHTLIVTPGRVYDPCNAEDYRALQMEMFVSNMELGNIIGRLQGGCRTKARMGCFIRPVAPYGFDRFRREDRLWTLVPNEQEAPIVRIIFERAAAGKPLGRIARDLNDAGHRTRCGGFWSAGRLGTIIKNPVYKGYIRYGYWHDEKIVHDGFKVERVRTKREEGEYIYVKGLHDPLVSEEMWQAANDRNNGCAPIKRSKELKNPLAGLLVCSKCGRSMLRFINTCKSNGNKIEHYRHAAFCDCHMRGARMSLVMSILVEALEQLAADIESSVTLSDPDTTADEIATIEKSLSREAGRIDKLIELYMNDGLTVEEYKERRAKMEEQIISMQDRLAELEAKDRPAPQEVVFTVREAIRQLASDDVSAAAKNEMLRTFIERIEFDNQTEHINEPDIRLHIILKS